MNMNWLTLRSVLKTAFVMGLVTVAVSVKSIFLPILVATVISFALHPLVKRFMCFPLPVWHRPMPHSIAIILSFIVAAIVLGGAVTFILLPFIEEFNKLMTNFPTIMSRTQLFVENAQRQYYEIPMLDSYRGLIEQGISFVTGFFVDMFQHIIRSVFDFATKAVELVVVPFLTFYFLKDHQLIRAAFVRLFPLRYREMTDTVLRECGEMMSDYIRGQIVVSLIMGVAVFIGMSFFHIDYPLVIALLAGLVETIPVVGPIIGAIPPLMLAIFIDPWLALKVLIFYSIVQQTESHLIVPTIMGHSIHLHPAIIIIAVLAGNHLLGIAGMVLATPLAALLNILFKHIWDIRSERDRHLTCAPKKV